MLLRVIISQQDIRKVKLDTIPDSIEDFQLLLKGKLNIHEDFKLQYEDEDFSDFCNLTCITDLPKEKATLKLLLNPATALLSHTSIVDSSAISVSSLSSSPSASSRSQQWPTHFTIPNCSFDVEFRLKQGNDAYRKDGTLLKVSRDMQIEILDKISEEIYSFKAYPANEDFECVAIALVEKHPCLKEPGSTAGWYGWKISLKFKMGNYRQKLRDAGVKELRVNSEKRGPGDTRGTRNKVKKPRRSEVNFLPEFPEGKDSRSLDEEREEMAKEIRKRNADFTIVDRAMSITYSLRRQEIIDDCSLSELRVRWPALFTKRQIITEFSRLMSMDLNASFYEGLDSHLVKLLQFYRSKPLESNPKMAALLKSLDNDASNQRKRAAVLLGLPSYLKEDSSNFIKICELTDPEEAVVRGITIGILTVVDDIAEPLPATYNNVALIIEEQVVLQNLNDLPDAFVNLVGLLYALNLNYPKELRYTFEVIQRLFIGIGKESCSPKVHSLKNKLLT